MAVPSDVPEGGKFRAVAAAALDGTAGAWGDADLLCVQIDANGEIALGGVTACDGVIWTKEGRNATIPGTVINEVIGGRTYTVMRIAGIEEMQEGASPPGNGPVYAAAAGNITAAPAAGAIFVGFVLADTHRIELAVGGRPAAP